MKVLANMGCIWDSNSRLKTTAVGVEIAFSTQLISACYEQLRQLTDGLKPPTIIAA